MILGLWLLAGAVQAETASQQQLQFKTGALPDSWTVCASACGTDKAVATRLFDQGKGLRIVVPGDAAATARLASLAWRQDPQVAEDGRRWISESEDPAIPARVYVHIPAGGHLATIDVSLPAGALLEIATGEGFIPEQLPGFGSFYSSVNVVSVSSAGQIRYEPGDEPQVAVTAAAGEWFGVRNRFWAWLWQSAEDPFSVEIDQSIENQPVLRFRPPAGSQRLSFHVYAGPVARAELLEVAPELGELLFAALWDWLRLLCTGMLLLLEGIHGLVGNYGVAIILLSLAVKVLMWPLTAVADRWQAQVNAIQSRLKPALDEIKANYKGEEAHDRTLAVYREHGVHPMYTFKSLAGFLIQIPVFIAAFDMLGENFALGQAEFLWVADLAKPDRWALLPWALPFFGQHLNLLPFLMTILSTVAAWLQRDASLSPELMRQQQIRLYLMAAAFFVLFYTFPAGMVLYWASNNLFHLLKVLFSAAINKNR
ncbi:MAG: YidC/Oxa1 family membrane protein insertase [Gammaproteobacteria bacterium]